LRFARFLVVGVLNTAVSYAVYLALLYVLDYRIAYTIAYVVGLALGYWLQARFVFQTPVATRSAVAYVATYVTMYVASVLMLWVAVDLLGVSKPWAMLIALCVTVPTTFLLLQRGFRARS